MEQSNITNIQDQNIRPNLRYEILTAEGFKPFYGIRKLQKNEWFKLKFTDGKEIGCSGGHLVQHVSGKFIAVRDLEAGVLLAGPGHKVVLEITRIVGPVTMYDVVETPDHTYVSSGFISHNCDFLTSGNGVFEPEDLKYYEDNFCKDPLERRGLDGNLWIWEYPDYSRNYMVSADVARGDGADYSAFHIWDVDACTQVAEYKGQLTPRDFGATLCGIASEYNNALLVVENANIGWSTIEEIIARGYPNLYYSVVGGGRNETAESYVRKMETGKTVAGFSTTPATRPLIISKLYDFIHTRSVILRSKRLIEEMRVFIWSKSGKAEAAQGYNDDLCMSAGIGMYVRDTAIRNKQVGVEATRSVLGSFVNLNKRDPKPESRTAFVQNPYIMQTRGGQEDISWVL